MSEWTWIKPDASGNRLNYPNIIQHLQRRTKIFECKLQHPATASTEPGWSMACKPLQRIPMNAMFRSLASCTRLIQIHPDSQTSSNSKSSLAPSANTFATVTWCDVMWRALVGDSIGDCFADQVTGSQQPNTIPQCHMPLVRFLNLDKFGLLSSDLGILPFITCGCEVEFRASSFNDLGRIVTC